MDRHQATDHGKTPASLDTIVSNAHRGEGPCTGCPAHEDTEGRFVNPGLLNPAGEIMFLTIDPSHYTDWSKYDSWAEYNAAKAPMFHKAPGGRALTKLLDDIPGIDLDDCWLADAIKCPVNNDRATTQIDSAIAFDHCRHYLADEIESVDPQVIVTLGNDPSEQLLNDYYDLDLGTINAGTKHAGTSYDTDPPVIVSPHWANGWFGRHNNREKVRTAIQNHLAP